MEDKYKPIVYTKKTEDEDISEKFIKHVRLLTHMIYRRYYMNPKPIKLTPQEQKEFQSAKVCHICEQDLNVDKETGQILKVRDHCHFTEEYRGAAHNECNLKCRKTANSSSDISQSPKLRFTSFHKTTFQDFRKKIKVGEYFSRKMGKLFPIVFEIRFIDSYKFLQTSLVNLVSNLQPTDFKNLSRVIKENTSLLTRKGVYPYDYVSSIDKLKETKLPSKDEFYSKLLDEEISEEDFQHAHNVWNTFNCQTLQDYHDLYLKSDVLLLADVFENFRKTCLKYYKLDPCHYFTAPGLAWDACLKETKQDLELLKDYDMLMMFEQGIRRGITHISKRYAEANNKYMKKNMMKQNLQLTFNTSMQIIFMVGQCLKNFQLMVSNGLTSTNPK